MRTTHKHTQRLQRIQRIAQYIGLGAVCTMAAFVIGLETAGDVHPFDTSEAALSEDNGLSVQHVPLKGDMDLDGDVDVGDAMALLALADGLEKVTVDHIRLGDIDGDSRLTTKDVMRVLHALSLR